MERIQRILNHGTFNEYIQRIKTLEQGRTFCLHPIEHSIDVARIAYILWLEHCLAEGVFSVPANDSIVRNEIRDFKKHSNAIKSQLYAASLLHDIGKYRQYLYGENHAEVSAELASEILIEVGFDADERHRIIDAIYFHNGCESEHELTWLLQKADRLSRKCYQCKEQARCYKIDKMETKQGLLY